MDKVKNYKEHKIVVIKLSNTIVEPVTMVVKESNTSITFTTVLSSIVYVSFTHTTLIVKLHILNSVSTKLFKNVTLEQLEFFHNTHLGLLDLLMLFLCQKKQLSLIEVTHLRLVEYTVFEEDNSSEEHKVKELSLSKTLQKIQFDTYSKEAKIHVF